MMVFVICLTQMSLNLIAKFTLNKSTQLPGRETNDSSKNLNIQCSSGFYKAVTKPAFILYNAYSVMFENYDY